HQGGREETMPGAARVKRFPRATSLSGSESPITKTPQNLLRLSIGLESAEDLVENLAQALEKADT
ncbi:MAG: cystathionine gamma-synthase, partial [Anaerolineae bacterium]